MNHAKKKIGPVGLIQAVNLICDLGCNPVVKMPYILIGYLTFKPKSFMGSAVTGTLFVEDNLGAIACEVSINTLLMHVVL